MGHNWKIIRKKLYGVLGSPGRGMRSIAMYDEGGNRTIEPLDATRFFVAFESQAPGVDTFTILAAIRDEGQLSHIDLKTPELDNEDDFNTMLGLLGVIRKTIGDREGIKINWQDFDGAIDPREEAVNNIRESKDIGKISGTTKSSFQRVGDARIIIRHTDTINEEKHGSRTRHIKAIFVENKAGERFAYPHRHLTGARAFARHVSHGGMNHDDVARKIFQLSEHYMALRRSSHVIRTSSPSQSSWIEGIRESMRSINRSLKSMQGPKRYESAVQELLKESSGIIDENNIWDLHQQIAECCAIQQDHPVYGDLGVAARYITGMPRMTRPMVFTWQRRPNITMMTQQDASSRLHDQIMELAGSCTNEEAVRNFHRIAEMISSGVMPEQSDIDLVKEAFASGMQHEVVATPLAEETELDEFLETFDPLVIFLEDGLDTPHEESNRAIDAFVESLHSEDGSTQDATNSVNPETSSHPANESSVDTDHGNDLSRLKNLAGM